MPTYTPTTLKAKIDSDIIQKTIPYSISNVDVGNDMKAIIDLLTSIANPSPPDPVIFTNQTNVAIGWNADMIAKCGAGGQFVVEILGDDGKYRQEACEIVPDSIVTTTLYTINLGQQCSGRIIIK